MEPSFWHSCWERNSLGFHQKSVHPFLEAYLKPRLSNTADRVFVPLCGKSDDMVWLANYMDVVGAELSDIACRDFFVEKGIDAEVSESAPFKQYRYQNIELCQGDFFQLSTSSIGEFDWIYDRAALIAMPESMQERYSRHLAKFITDKTTLFLVSLEFPSEELEGPPFPITSLDIERLFSGYNIECVAEHELQDKVFAQRKFDVSSLKERLYLISAK